MASLDPLRQQALKRTKAANDKIRRNADKGIFLIASQFDPRKSRGDIERMNRRQLNAYLKRVNAFVARDNQYVRGNAGTPLPRNLVRQYEALERQRNAAVERHSKQFANIYIAPAGMTVAQREATIKASEFNILTAGGTPEYRPYSAHQRSMLGVPSVEALKQLIKYEKRGAQASAIKRALQVQRRNHIAWLEKHGQGELATKIGKLTLRQFDLLKNYTSYTRHIEHMYLGKESAESESWAATIRDDNIGEAIALADWAGAKDTWQ